MKMAHQALTGEAKSFGHPLNCSAYILARGLDGAALSRAPSIIKPSIIKMTERSGEASAAPHYQN
jgi:hypothetical protein